MAREEPRRSDASPTEEERNPEGAPSGGVNVNTGWTPEREERKPSPEAGEDAPEEASGTLPGG